jgi:predicted transglutaminase-like cysteine proteinase
MAVADDAARSSDESIESLLAIPSPRSPPDLFGFTAVRLGKSIYDSIWSAASMSPWPSDAPELDVFADRLKRLPPRQRVQEVNAWINARVAYARDPVLSDHHWGNLATALSRHSGEREDIAIAKLQLLAGVGVPRRDMFLVLVRDASRTADDAVLLVRVRDQLYVLDSKQDQFLDAGERGRYVPVLAFSAEGRWVFGTRRRAPPIAPPQTRRFSYAALLDAGE